MGEVLAGEIARRHSATEGNPQGSRRLCDRPGPRKKVLSVAVHNQYKRLNHQTKHDSRTRRLAIRNIPHCEGLHGFEQVLKSALVAAVSAFTSFGLQNHTLAVLSEHGKEAVVALLGTGDFFGEGCSTGSTSRPRPGQRRK
jgi:hypothetical protein